MSATNQAAPETGSSALAKQRIRSLLQSAGMLPVLILIGILFQVLSGYTDKGVISLTDGRFLSPENLRIVAQNASINTILAAGMTFVILTGGIDLSVGSIVAVSAVSAVMVSLVAPTYGILPILTGLLVGTGFGLINGTLISGLKLPPFIVTLGSLTAVRGIGRLLTNDTQVSNFDLPYAALGNSGFEFPFIGQISWLAIIAIVIIALSWFILRRTVLGVHIYAVGGNPAAARLSGIKVPWVLLFVYGLTGFLSGLGGVLESSRENGANALLVGNQYELDAIAAVVLGGTSLVGGVGSVIGTLIGALIIAVLANGLTINGVSDVWQYIIKGLVIIAAVTLDKFRNKGGART